MELTVNMCGRQELARKLLAEVIPPEACKDIYSPKPAFLQKPFLWLSHSFRGELKCARVCEIAAAHSGDELVLQSFSKFFQQEHWIKTAHFHLKIAALTWLYPPKAMLHYNAQLKLFSSGSFLTDSRIWPCSILKKTFAFKYKRQGIFDRPTVFLSTALLIIACLRCKTNLQTAEKKQGPVWLFITLFMQHHPYAKVI